MKVTLTAQAGSVSITLKPESETETQHLAMAFKDATSRGGDAYAFGRFLFDSFSEKVRLEVK